MNGGRPELPGVPARGISVAFSTPRPDERLASDGGLLASAPDPVSSANHDGPPLRAGAVNRCPRRTRLPRWLPRPVPVWPDVPGIRSPLKTPSRVTSGA